MTAKILQPVNSPYFAFRMQVTDPIQAVQLLGLETVRALVLSLHLFSRLDERTYKRFRLAKIWRHSLGATSCAQMVARSRDEGVGPMTESFTAALLHDIGKLVLATSLPAEYAEVVRLAESGSHDMESAEEQLLGSTHATVGAYLLSLWGLPEGIVEAVAWHHRPSDCVLRQLCPVGAVHVADALEHDIHPADSIGCAPQLDEAYLARTGVAWQYPAWRAACLDAAGEGLGKGLAARL